MTADHAPSYPRRRYNRHTIYVRPAEAQIGYEAIDALMGTDDAYGADEDLARLRDKLYAIDWQADYEPPEGVET